MRYRIIVLLILTVISSVSVHALNLHVRVFSENQIKAIDFKPVSGNYDIYSEGNHLVTLLRHQGVKISVVGNSIRLENDKEDFGDFKRLHLKGKGFITAFKITPKDKGIKARTYDDDVVLEVRNGFLHIVNDVELEHYVAGVVQSEGGGSTKAIEFFLVQAITCRTYALNNFRKHINEGFNLCDAVHCQAYYGRCRNSDILMATLRTRGEVIVDEEMKMIAAAFHSNSGGQTLNSEHAWSIATPYLKGRVDTFSHNQQHYSWNKTIAKKDFKTYLKKTWNFNTADSRQLQRVYNYPMQAQRPVFFIDSIPLKYIRREFKLRSTWFSIQESGDSLFIQGRGFGHGVGMSQEGAINMAQSGYKYTDIIHYYYTGVKIVNFHKLTYLIRSLEKNNM